MYEMAVKEIATRLKFTRSRKKNVHYSALVLIVDDFKLRTYSNLFLFWADRCPRTIYIVDRNLYRDCCRYGINRDIVVI
jgi:hypothetical protein